VQPWYRKLFSSDTTPDEDLTVLAQAIVDLRRAFDLLIARPDVDRKRLAYVGHSFGAQFGAVLTSVDQRMTTAVLLAGHPSAAVTWFETDDPELVQVRKTVGDEALRHEIDVISVLDAIHFVPHAAPISLLFQFARYEHISQDRMKAYAQAASKPKSVRWYSSGHALNDPAALADRAEWLEAKIGLRSARAAVSR
jgi:dienelactone hydrolase